MTERVVRHAGGKDAEDMTENVQDVIDKESIGSEIIDVDISPYVDEFGAKDDEWYKAVVVMEIK